METGAELQKRLSTTPPGVCPVQLGLPGAWNRRGSYSLSSVRPLHRGEVPTEGHAASAQANAVGLGISDWEDMAEGMWYLAGTIPDGQLLERDGGPECRRKKESALTASLNLQSVAEQCAYGVGTPFAHSLEEMFS